jgi:branched-chain amino acid transport system permease protein
MDQAKPRHWIAVALQLGATGGLAALLISLVGMVEEFSKRYIIVDVLEMGQAMLLLILIATGYMTARRLADRPPREQLLASAVSGLVPAVMLFALVLLIEPLNLRSIMLNASPGLIEILTFGQTGIAAFVLMAAAGVAQALAGGVVPHLATRIRAPLVQAVAWVGLTGLLADILRVTFTNIPGASFVLGWMFGRGSGKGLSIPGAVVVFGLVAYATYRRQKRPAGAPGWRSRLDARKARLVNIGLWAAAAVILFLLPKLLGPYLSEVTNSVGLFVLMGLGLNIVVGFAGLLDLGYVAFYAIGAYVVGVLTTSAVGDQAGQIVWGPVMSFWLALMIAVLASVMAGIVLGVPVLNMRGDYLAIVTLGFGEIIRIMAGSDFLKPFIGGSQGIVQVGVGRIGGLVIFDKPQTLFYVVVAACAAAGFISWRLRDSRMGRTWKALREDEDVAQAMGIHLVSTKLLAFATGAAFAGLSGALFASKVGSIYPHSFKLLVSINVLCLIIVGGMGSLPGVFIGALALVALPEMLREFSEYRLLMYGALLIVMMLTRPEGLRPEATRRRELHETIGPELEPPPEGVATPGEAAASG